VNVGFVGLGRMGTPMARCLLRAGFPLTVFNRTRRRALLLGDEGATVAESPAEVSARCDVVVTMLADGDAVTAVLSGPAGLLAQAREETVLLEMSTIGPRAARELARQAAERGAKLLDAPVSGSVAAAESASLTTLVGGDHGAFNRVRPVLAAMTREQLWLGPSGAGAAMKLGLNGLIAATNHAVSEALVIAERSGIDRVAAYDAISASAVGSPFVAYKRDAFLTPSNAPVAFTLALMQKDLALYLDLAQRLGVPAATAAGVHHALDAARASQGDDADLAAVAQALRAAAMSSSDRARANA
jgi:3-hydroxyisobutyrate dehydrogenase-like beta-hydroxyacid dehydrogenase